MGNLHFATRYQSLCRMSDLIASEKFYCMSDNWVGVASDFIMSHTNLLVWLNLFVFLSEQRELNSGLFASIRGVLHTEKKYFKQCLHDRLEKVAANCSR